MYEEILHAVSLLIFDGLRLSGNERSNYIESNNLGQKKLSGIRNREDPVFRVFYHIKKRREKFGTDGIVRFYGDSGIERIRFRGFLLYYSLLKNKNFEDNHIRDNIAKKMKFIFDYINIMA